MAGHKFDPEGEYVHWHRDDLPTGPVTFWRNTRPVTEVRYVPEVVPVQRGCTCGGEDSDGRMDVLRCPVHGQREADGGPRCTCGSPRVIARSHEPDCARRVWVERMDARGAEDTEAIRLLEADLACERDALLLAQQQREHATRWAQHLAATLERYALGMGLTEGGASRLAAEATAAGFDPRLHDPVVLGRLDADTKDEFDGAGCCPEEDGWLRAKARSRDALTCACCHHPFEARGDTDPWGGRLDDYCYECALARCDAYPGECPDELLERMQGREDLPAGTLPPPRLRKHGPWRVGRKVGRTIYAQQGEVAADDDPLIGMMDTPELARAVVDAINRQPLRQPAGPAYG